MKPDEDPPLRYGRWQLHVTERLLTDGERVHRLTKKACQLLETLIRHQGQVLTRQFLMLNVWQTDYAGDTRTVEVHIHWLRQKLEDEPASPVHLQTVRGDGWILRGHLAWMHGHAPPNGLIHALSNGLVDDPQDDDHHYGGEIEHPPRS